MSQAVQAALPWIVCAIAAAILIPGIIDFLRKKKPEANASEKEKAEQNSWMMEGIGVGMLAGYWLGKVFGAVGYRHIFKIYAQINVKSYYLTEAPA
jgi:UDP-N-acetylmuramyl pentapeptide phosphotransferase/UDP-N-acetylglucosamine-1-phosphate transferase